MGARERLLRSASLALLPSCSAGTYLRDRGLDLTDVVDLKAGLGPGIGAKVEATDYLGTGLGVGMIGARELYGRKSEDASGLFLHALAYGGDGLPIACGGRGEKDQVFVQSRIDGKRPAPLSRARIGGEVLLLAIDVGLYANLGELVDFFAGLAGFDPSDDDDLAKGTRPALVAPEPAEPPATRPATIVVRLAR